MPNPHPIEITNLQQLFLSKETKEDIEDINNGEYTETKQHGSNAGILRGAFYTANVVRGKRKNYIHRVKGGLKNQNDYDANNNHQQAFASAMNSAFMNAIGVRSHYVIYDNYLEHCGEPYHLKIPENIQNDNNFFLHTFLAFLIYGFLDRSMKNVCINDNKEFINIDLDDDNFSWCNSFPEEKNTTWDNEILTPCNQFGELNFLPNGNNIISDEVFNNIDTTINKMVNFNLENVVKALIDEVVKFYKKDNNYQNMLLALKTTIDAYVKKVGCKLSLLSQGTFHQHFRKNYGNQHPLSHLMEQIAKYENDIKTKANQLLTFDLNINWLDGYLTDKFKENINNNSLTKEQLSTLCSENGILSYNNFSLEKAINNALLTTQNNGILKQENNNLLGLRSIVNKSDNVFLNNIESKIEGNSRQSSQEERETKNFYEKCLNNISNCCGLC